MYPTLQYLSDLLGLDLPWYLSWLQPAPPASPELHSISRRRAEDLPPPGNSWETSYMDMIYLYNVSMIINDYHDVYDILIY